MTTMNFTAKDVQELRQRTGAGMMDCKKALTEMNGDLNAAVEYLRTKGIAKAESRSGRTTSEGMIGSTVSTDAAIGVLAEVNCETDFVARTDDFKALVDVVLQHALHTDVADVDALLAAPVGSEGGKTLDVVVKERSAKLGEVVNVRRFVRYAVGSGAVGMYTHHNAKVGVLVEATLGNPDVATSEPVQAMLKAIAEHAAAMNPLALDRTGIAPELIEKEKRIAEDQARQSGKPEAMIEKIATGKLEAFFKDMSLVSQPWVREPKKTITDLIRETAKTVDTEITVTRFVRFALGDA
ncbi:MAG: elongation factor Ts [Gemmatimonadaceae bacterium]|nr:elongation factor Ts [Gemmatimonadaceae bacterium]